MEAYTYLIGWSKMNRWYYGCRYAKNCTPTDLWKTYFTSSNYVKNFRKDHGDPDIMQIRRVFDSKDKCIEWENKVLQKMNVIKEEKWLNKTNNRAIIIENKEQWKKNMTGVKKTLTEKLLKAKKLNGILSRGKSKPKPSGFGKKISESKIGKSWYYNPITLEETFSKENLTLQGFIKSRSPKTKHGGNRGKYDKNRSDKTAEKLSKTYKILTPNGDTIIVTNLSKFCRENNLYLSNLTKKGKCKGYIFLERLN